METPATRTCPRCGETKPASGFYVSKQSGYGLTCYCRDCIKAEVAANAAKRTPEQLRAAYDRRAKRDQARRLSDDQFVAAERAKQKRYRDKVGNPPPRRADPEAHAAYMREWRAGNIERAREIARAGNKKYMLADPERARLINAIRSANQRAKKLGVPGRIVWTEWQVVVEKYQHCCAYCGADDCLLDLDHVDAMTNGGDNVVANIAPACRPCNGQKHRRTLEEFCALRGLDPAAIRARAVA